MELLMTAQQQKDVFLKVEFVDKNNLEGQNPRRDTSIPSVSAGLPLPGLAVSDPDQFSSMF